MIFNECPWLLRSILGLSTLIFLTSCDFEAYNIAYHFEDGKNYALQYSAKLKAKTGGSWGFRSYTTSADANFTLTGRLDTSKGQTDFSLKVDKLVFKSDERAPGEDDYMQERLSKYRARLVLTRTGQVLSLEEEPGMPPVEFSPLHFGRLLIYALPAFPDKPIKKETQWESRQPLLDKFHPESQILRRYRLKSVRESSQGKIGRISVELKVVLETGLDSLKGSGEVEFNLDKGLPISIQLQVEGRFSASLPENSVDSASSPSMPLFLQESLSLKFSE